MQAPFDGYLFVVKATSDRHFAMLDANFTELRTGLFHDMYAHMRMLEGPQKKELIWLYCEDTQSVIQVTDETLRRTLELDPDYLDDKEFIEEC